MLHGGISDIRLLSQPRSWVAGGFRSAFRHETQVVQQHPFCIACSSCSNSSTRASEPCDGEQRPEETLLETVLHSGGEGEGKGMGAVRESQNKILKRPHTLQAPSTSRLQVRVGCRP
ncbi:hypothetical protein CGRA01v4_09631 [Colletotrichum graminicola]|nr:hypothetical protein CGRA01v4_09631 [Colletotrichum graminicola]